MYPYHNKIKQRIRQGEMVSYEFVKGYRNIGECMLIHFYTEPKVRPVRPCRYKEYEEVLACRFNAS